MMKRSLWKRIVAGAAAIMLVGTMGISAMASYEGASEEGSITVHKYSKVTNTGNPNLTGEAITDTSGLGTPLRGVGFTLYKLTMPTVPADTTYTDSYTAVYDVDGTTVTGVTMNFTNGDTGLATAAIVGTEAFTNVSGEIVFGSGSTLAKGYYLLVESTPLTGYAPTNPAIISLPLTNGAGTGYVYNVHVYPKNVSTQPITKILDDASRTYVVGEDVSFTINAAIQNSEAAPDTVASVADLKIDPNYGEMKIMDTLVGGLTYKSFKIYASKPNGTKLELDSAEYTFTNTNGALVWELTTVGIDALIAEGAEALEVKITATVKASNEALTNTASSFIKKAGALTDPEIPVTPGVVVPTGVINILKVDAADDAGLSGAIFAIANNQAGTIFLKKDGTFTAEITSLAGLTAVKDDLLLATTGTDGKAVFSGLTCDVAAITDYRLVEIQSPTGYQLKEAAINADLPIVVDASAGAKNDVTVTNYANGTIDKDNPKFSLPLTGGTGTIFFTVVGILIMAATVVVYYRFKKRSNKVR